MSEMVLIEKTNVKKVEKNNKIQYDVFEYEKKYIQMGYKTIAGMDEAGRGPLAGPVCVACVVMPLEQDRIIEKINDSKKLSEKTREMLFEKIIETALSYKIVMIDNKEIDQINILQATKKGMLEAVNTLEVKPDILLCDYINSLDYMGKKELIIKGDQRSYNISAASILAKVARDRYMHEIALKMPEYEFEKHKGYGTSLHYENIKKYGISEIHRKSFLKNLDEK